MEDFMQAVRNLVKAAKKAWNTIKERVLSAFEYLYRPKKEKGSKSPLFASGKHRKIQAPKIKHQTMNRKPMQVFIRNSI